jgi:hypothetical protein
MKLWLVRLGVSLLLVGSTACSNPTTKQAPAKLDPSIKLQKLPAPPPIPKAPPKTP